MKDWYDYYLKEAYDTWPRNAGVIANLTHAEVYAITSMLQLLEQRIEKLEECKCKCELQIVK